MNGSFSKVLVAIGSLASIGFGVWHFSVPRTWQWYSHMDPGAPELAIAVRAINFFFSLSLVLFGLLTGLLALGKRSNDYSIAVALGATSILWLSRVVLQLLWPQGSARPALQYSMLAIFILVFLCQALPLAIALGKVTRR